MKIEFLSIEDVVDNLKHTTIKKSTIHGKGLFTTKNIKEKFVLGVLDGQIVPKYLYEIVEAHMPTNLISYMFMEWNAISNSELLVRNFRTKYSFINHSRNPNLEINSTDMSIYALEDIPKDVELTLDYRKEMLSVEYLNGHGKTYL